MVSAEAHLLRRAGVEVTEHYVDNGTVPHVSSRITVNADIQARAVTLAKVMTLEELEALQAKLIAAAEDEQRRRRPELPEAQVVDLDPKKIQ